MNESAKHDSAFYKYSALFFTIILIGFLITIFFVQPRLSEDQKNILNLIYPFIGGFSTFFLSGTALLRFTSTMGSGTRIVFSASAGVAVYVFLFLHPAIPQQASASETTKKIILIDNYARRYDENSQETNAYYISNIIGKIAQSENIKVDAEQILVGPEFNNHASIINKRPDLVIIHMSSFFGSTNSKINRDEFKKAMQDFQLFVSYLLKNSKNPSLRVLVYTRLIPESGIWDTETHKLVKDNFEAQTKFISDLNGKVDLFTVPWGSKFVEPSTSILTEDFLRKEIENI